MLMYVKAGYTHHAISASIYIRPRKILTPLIIGTYVASVCVISSINNVPSNRFIACLELMSRTRLISESSYESYLFVSRCG
jgi:hypothetical protein